MDPGMICVFTGIDGAGKTTRVIPEIVMHLQNDMVLNHIEWRPVTVLKSPTTFMEHMSSVINNSKSPLVKATIQMADNYKHMNTCLSRSIRGDIVISDRWWYDAFVYNYLELSDSVGSRAAERILKEMYPNVAVVSPTVCFLCIVPPDVAHARKPDYPIEFMERVFERYVKVSRNMFEMEYIDCCDVDAAVDQIYRKIVAHIDGADR